VAITFEQFRNLYLLQRMVGNSWQIRPIFTSWLKTANRLEPDKDTVRFDFAGQYVMEVAYSLGIGSHPDFSFQEFMMNAEKNFGDGFLSYVAHHCSEADVRSPWTFKLSSMENNYRFWEKINMCSRRIAEFYKDVNYTTLRDWEGRAHKDKRIELKDCETLLKSVMTKSIITSQPMSYLTHEGYLDGLILESMKTLAMSGDMKKAKNVKFYELPRSYNIEDPDVAFTLQRNYHSKGFYCALEARNPGMHTIWLGYYGPCH